MNPQGVWQAWEGEISRVLPEVGVWQRRALALFSLGIASAKHCGLARVAAVVPGLASVPSLTRRFERLLANEHLDVRAARRAVAAAVLESGRGQTLWLALDETHQGRTETGTQFGMLALRLLYRERAIPLAWVCYRPGAAPAPFPTLIGHLIEEVAARVPLATRVVLMTDRGLSWPSLLDQCRRVGWSFLCRVQGQTRVQTTDGRTGPVRALAPRPGSRWRGPGRAFLKAGWRTVNLVAVWRRRDDQPWLLVTDLPPTWRCCAQYRHRMDEEESFRDDKSAGFDWNASRIRDPRHMDRLLLVLQLAAVFVLAQGAFVLRHGFRPLLERPDRRTLSLFSLGLRWLDRARSHFVPLSTSLLLPFP
jgi:Transposase DDE domain